MKVWFVVLPLLALAAMPVSALVPSEWTGDGNNLDFSILQPGDIIACDACAGWLTDVVPGHYEHVSMYIGNGQMVAWKDGVRVIPMTTSGLHIPVVKKFMAIATTAVSSSGLPIWLLDDLT